MHEENALKEESSHLRVSHVLSQALQHGSQSLTQEGLALILTEETESLAILEKYFNLVTNLAILEVALDQSVVDHGVGRALWHECLEQDIRWNKELLLVIDELEDAVSVLLVMQSHSLSEHIISNTSHLHRIWREELRAVDEAASLESHWVVPLVHDQHTDDSLVAINDEVASELVHVLLGLDQLVLSHVVQVAEL